jgi:Transposase IS116/IS110/IS902 family
VFVQRANALDLRLDRVAGWQPALQAKGDAARRARGDHLAQMQIELAEAVGNQLGDAHQHLPRPGEPLRPAGVVWGRAGAGRQVPRRNRRHRSFPTKHHFAAHTATAPLKASSGQVVRHRLSRAGDRKLNHALYMMAMAQVRRPSTGQAYDQRKLAEGKSPRKRWDA